MSDGKGQSILARTLEAYKDLPDEDIAEELAKAKHHKAGFQSIIEACYVIQQRRRERGVRVPRTQ